jgi:hypothetical protein
MSSKIAGGQFGLSRIRGCSVILQPGWYPTGKSVPRSGNRLSSPFCKNISVFPKCKPGYMIRYPVPRRGVGHRHERWDGMRWTRQCPRMVLSQGGLWPVSDQSVRRRTALKRTAKSCGPDASTPASSLAEVLRARPGGQSLNPRGDGDKKARSPGRARYKP